MSLSSSFLFEYKNVVIKLPEVCSLEVYGSKMTKCVLGQ